MYVAAAFEFGQQFGHEGGLYQAAFVVAFFVPRVGEEDVYAVQTAVGQHIFDDFHRVVAHHAYVGDVLFVYQFEQVADARPVYVDGEEVVIGQAAGDFGGGRPHAEANFEYFPVAAAESLVQVGRRFLIIQAELRPQGVDGALLGGGHVALAQDVAADAAVVLRVLVCFGDLVGHGRLPLQGRLKGMFSVFRRPAAFGLKDGVRRFVMDDVADFVVLVHQYDFGLVGGDFGFGQHDVGHDDDDVALLHQPCRRAVQANSAAAAFAGDGIGFQPRAVVVVYDGDFFIDADACGIHQVGVYGDAADVVQVSFGYGGAVDFAAEQGSEHVFSFDVASHVFRRPFRERRPSEKAKGRHFR